MFFYLKIKSIKPFLLTCSPSKCSYINCVVIFIPWYDIKVTMLRLQMVPEDLPAQFDAPPLHGGSMGGTAHEGGSEGDLQDMDVIVVAEQLHGANTTRLRK